MFQKRLTLIHLRILSDPHFCKTEYQTLMFGMLCTKKTFEDTNMTFDIYKKNKVGLFGC